LVVEVDRLDEVRRKIQKAVKRRLFVFCWQRTRYKLRKPEDSGLRAIA
jgi:hypothetical protein